MDKRKILAAGAFAVAFLLAYQFVSGEEAVLIGLLAGLMFLLGKRSA